MCTGFVVDDPMHPVIIDTNPVDNERFDPAIDHTAHRQFCPALAEQHPPPFFIAGDAIKRKRCTIANRVDVGFFHTQFARPQPAGPLQCVVVVNSHDSIRHSLQPAMHDGPRMSRS